MPLILYVLPKFLAFTFLTPDSAPGKSQVDDYILSHAFKWPIYSTLELSISCVLPSTNLSIYESNCFSGSNKEICSAPMLIVTF